MSDSAQNSLADLLERARAGDATERDRLFERCRGYLGVVAQTQVESWLRAKVDASDLVQQTLLEAHRDFERFDGQTEGEWLAWLRKILSHNAADFVRRYAGTAKRAARREIPLRSPGDDSQLRGSPEPAAKGPTPSQVIVLHDQQVEVAEAMSKLTEDHRQVIILRNLERLPFDEIGRRMGRSRPAVQMLWMRAIKKLQEALA